MKAIYLLLTALLLTFSLGCQQKKDPQLDVKLKNLEQRLDAFSNTSKDSLGNPIVTADMQQQLTELRMQMRVYDGFISSLEGSLTQLGHVLSDLQILFTFMALAFSIFQVYQYVKDGKKEAKSQERSQQSEDRLFKSFTEQAANQEANTNKILENYQSFILSLQDKQEQNNRELLGAVKTNISETTALITSYKKLISLQQIAQEFEGTREEILKLLSKDMMKLNEDALRQYHALSMESDGEANNSYWRGDFESYFDEADGFIRDSKLQRFNKRLNAAAYFLIGMHYSSVGGQIKSARKNFEWAIEEAKKCLDPMTVEEKADIFPGNSESQHLVNGVEQWCHSIMSKSHFYLGLGYYRLRDYQSARKHFEEAKRYDGNDIQTNFFYFQAQYWGEIYENLDRAATEMIEFKDRITKIWTAENHSEAAVSMLNARLYMKLADFKTTLGPALKYSASKDDLQALSYYKDAYAIVFGLNGDVEHLPHGFEHIAPMVYFAYGRTIKNAAANQLDVSAHPAPDLLFGKAEAFCRKFDMNIQNPETKYLLVYIMAECQKCLAKPDEARNNIMRASEYLDEYCSNPSFYGYSPVSNQMLKRDELRQELRDFNRNLG